MERNFATRFATTTVTLFVVVCPAMHADDAALHDVLSDQQWQHLDASVERGLQWLASEQQRDGSFPTMPNGQPGVTSLCVLAFMAHGHVPGEGPYGMQLEKAIDFVMSCQKRNGLLANVVPNRRAIPRNVSHQVGYTAVYNHAISGLLLSEAYAIIGDAKNQILEGHHPAGFGRNLGNANWPKDRQVDLGGWRYLDDNDREDSDLSVSGWQLMFLRSAKNAGFDVASKPIDEAIGYVRRCYRKDYRTFTYKIVPEDRTSRAMAGAGVLALAHAGLHNTPEAQQAGDWLLRNSFQQYNFSPRNRGRSRNDDRYHYGLLMGCQAMYQLGGEHWRQFFPKTVRVVLDNQLASGAWPVENHRRDARFGNAYTTSLCLLALGAPNQLLPVFQR